MSTFFKNINPRTGRNYTKPVIQYDGSKIQRELCILMDTREKDAERIAAIKKRLALLGMGEDRLLTGTLDIGDYAFVHRSDPTKRSKLVIEFKTCSDLATSIKDGRFSEQLYRLNINDVSVIHLIEGNMLEQDYGILTKGMLGAVAHAALRNDTQPCTVKDKDASADFITAMLMYLQFMPDFDPNAPRSYVDYVHIEVKKKDFRDEFRLQLMLATFVDRVSPEIAKAVSAEFTVGGEAPSIADLQVAFLRSKNKTLVRVANIQYEVEGRKHRIGPAAAHKIYDMCDVEKLRKFVEIVENNDDEEEEEEEEAPKKKAVSRGTKESLKRSNASAKLPIKAKHTNNNNNNNISIDIHEGFDEFNMDIVHTDKRFKQVPKPAGYFDDDDIEDDEINEAMEKFEKKQSK